jgi:beta-phosphoglucomutase-like phosphatase (HAD superfamily)
MCRHHGFEHDALVCYHDAKPKPAPDSFLFALKRFGLQTDEAIGVGDDLPDSLALEAAHIRAFGAGWSPVLNPESKWERVLGSPSEIEQILSLNSHGRTAAGMNRAPSLTGVSDILCKRLL